MGGIRGENNLMKKCHELHWNAIRGTSGHFTMLQWVSWNVCIEWFLLSGRISFSLIWLSKLEYMQHYSHMDNVHTLFKELIYFSFGNCTLRDSIGSSFNLPLIRDSLELNVDAIYFLFFFFVFCFLFFGLVFCFCFLFSSNNTFIINICPHMQWSQLSFRSNFQSKIFHIFLHQSIFRPTNQSINNLYKLIYTHFFLFLFRTLTNIFFFWFFFFLFCHLF